MPKKSKVISASPSKEEAQALMGDYARASAEKRRLEALKDQEMNKVREKYQQRLDEQDALMTAAFDQIHAWAMANREDEFKAKKSQDWAFGTVGYLMHPPKVALRKGFTWASVVEMLKSRDAARYLRRIDAYEIAKEAVLSDRDDPEAASLISACGMELRQDEQFFIKPKEDAV
jgi:phage host-nuclease inhibitor protein Gam